MNGETSKPRRAPTGTRSSPMLTKLVTVRTGQELCPVEAGLALNRTMNDGNDLGSIGWFLFYMENMNSQTFRASILLGGILFTRLVGNIDYLHKIDVWDSVKFPDDRGIGPTV